MPVVGVAGAIVGKPVAVAGRVEARAVLPVVATFDHRYYDGFAAGELQRAFFDCLADPGAHEPAPDSPATAVSVQRKQANLASKLVERPQALTSL